MKKPLYYLTFILSLNLVACGTADDTPVPDNSGTIHETEQNNDVEYSANKVNMTVAQDTSIPFSDRLAKIANELYSDKTIDGKDRNITVDNIGDMYYLKMMFDDVLTKDGIVYKANLQMIELFKVLQQLDGYEAVSINWQGTTDSGELVSIVTALAKKSDIDAMDFESIDPADLKSYVTNYGLHKDLH